MKSLTLDNYDKVGFLRDSHHLTSMADRFNAIKRKRGIILSSQGWQRLQAAEHLSAIRENAGKPYTLVQLSALTGLSNNTLTKVRRRQKQVDQLTLEAYFQAFELKLAADDCLTQECYLSASAIADLQQTLLKGQLEIDSPFYIYRPPVERLCMEEILKPGALLRVKAPRQFGINVTYSSDTQPCRRSRLRHSGDRFTIGKSANFFVIRTISAMAVCQRRSRFRTTQRTGTTLGFAVWRKL